jgi:hypothetical protein
MSEIFVAGADFSGAKTIPNDTWLAVGHLTSVGLEITSLTHVGAHKLAQELNETKFLVAVGLDFPFSLPFEFLNYMAEQIRRGPFEEWEEVAETLAFMTFEQFLKLAQDFKLEPKRTADKAVTKPAISPLHRGNPSMVQMTFYGIRMLTSLNPKLFFVIPFQNQIPFGCAVMETYPRETLFSLGLPDTGYKSKDSDKSLEVRKEIIKQLSKIRNKKIAGIEKCPQISWGKFIEKQMTENDHALDAVISCYSTAIWQTTKEFFQDPYASDDANVLVEGWIYSPSLLQSSRQK